jgi:hypothetical protein
MLLMLTGSASATTLVSSTAGFAGTSSQSCSGTANNFEIEIVYNAASCQRQGIVEFSLAGTSLTTVDSAIITLFDGAVGNSEAWYWPVDVYGYEGDLAVTDADFDAGTYITTATWFRYAPDAARFSIDLTNFVNTQLALGTSILGLNLRANGEYFCQTCAIAFIYFDGAGGDSPPTLTLAAVPAPSEVWLIAAALVAVGGRRWAYGRPSDRGDTTS